jgi:hypothetical protein
MGDVKIRYYVTRKAWPGSRATWGYWVPSKKMQAAGFEMVACGEDGPLAWARAAMWNARWDEARKQLKAGVAPSRLERSFPSGSFGEGFAKFRKTQTWADKAPRTREDWERGWKYIEPVFGDVDPRTVALEDVDIWYGGDPFDPTVKGLLGEHGVREAHRAMKIWRALWNVLMTIKREDRERYATGKDPSLGIRRKTPKKGTAIWLYDEAEILIAGAGELGFPGLQAALAAAWDTMLSPVDVRKLSRAMRGKDDLGALFGVDRTKTGKAAIGTLTPRTEGLIDAYIASLPFTLHPDMPIFHTRGGEPGPKGGRPRPPAPYTKDTMSRDFRVVRDAKFKGDKRQLQHFRRSGALEVIAGQGGRELLAGKMANSIDSNAELEATYIPAHAAVVRLADEARSRGRELLRDRVRKNTSGPKS